jgi:Tol biopolymer transport system component
MTPGTKIGEFEILGRLGAGGMGEVYRARDTRLGRDVAIKILPAAVAADAGRLERLAREARLLASLNHPNIAAIYAVETAGPVQALILELVEGETLGVRLRRKPLTIAEARGIARQIASALDAAHACGIVHRDLKPENVMLGPRDFVKVLDFGVAKAGAALAGTDASTVSKAITVEGEIIGTVAYMSPEQARGLAVDRRTDIWAFGCVLYEMLTGRRAFRGETITDIVVATLEKDPDWSVLPADTPLGIRRLLKRTLQKDPHDRLRDIADGLVDLEEEPAASLAPPARVTGSWLPWALAAIAAATSVWLLIKTGAQAPVDPLARSVMTRLTRDAGLTTAPAVSRDGRLIAYASDRAGNGTLDIWVQQIAAGTSIRLTDGAADDTSPDFSPDGSQILFQSDREGGGAFLVSAFGSTQPRLVAPGARDARFSPDGSRIAYWSGAWRGGAANTATALYVVSPDGGAAQRLVPGFRSARTPVWSPDGQSLLFLGRSDTTSPPEASVDWWWVKLDGSVPRKVGLLTDPALRLAEAHPSAWTPDGVLYSDGQDLWAVPISQTSGEMLGAPRRLTVSAGAYALPIVSADGRIVFAAVEQVRVIERASLEPSANPQPPVQLYADFANNAGRPSETRDGHIIVFERPVGDSIEIWTRDLRTSVEQIITRVASQATLSATISPDGARIAYTVSRGLGGVGRGFVVETARGVPSQVCDGCVVAGFLGDGARLLLSQGNALAVHDVVRGTSLDAVTAEDMNLNRPHASPDDRWLAFRTQPTSGTSKSYVSRLTPGNPPGASDWIEIDDSFSGRPAGWSPDSRTVYLLLDTDGFRCLWGRRLDANGQAVGPVTAIRHFHGADWTQLSTSFGNAISSRGFLYSTIKSRGNIWSLMR